MRVEKMPKNIRNRGRTGATILPAERNARRDPAYPRQAAGVFTWFNGEEGEKHAHVAGVVVAKACPHGAEITLLLVVWLVEGDVQRNNGSSLEHDRGVSAHERVFRPHCCSEAVAVLLVWM